MMDFCPTFAIFTVILVFLSGSMLQLSLPYLKGFPDRPEYPSGVPNKFDPDGRVQHFPGNTVMCPLSNSSELYTSLLVLSNRLKQSPLSHLYALLPPSSWHMTVFEGVVDKVREPGYWPGDLATNASLEDCTGVFEKKLSSFDLQTKLPYHLEIIGFKPLKSGISLHIEGYKGDNAALRALRDRLADLLQIRFRNHDRYTFHVSVAYLLRHLTDNQKTELRSLYMDHFRDMPKELELGPPVFCRFEDMSAYRPLLYLKNWNK